MKHALSLLTGLTLPFLMGAELDEHRPAIGPADDGRWYTGAYSFSDELGGFRITGVAGTGSKIDPIIISQEFNSASAAILVIRAAKPIRPYAAVDQRYATGMMYVRIETLNNSNLPWIQFQFELQENLGKASVFGDGLSFDQRKNRSDAISSDLFEAYSRDFEPYDQLLFKEGSVDALETVTMTFYITDFTPRATFYLKQDPSIPYS